MKRRLGEALNIPLSNGINKYLGCLIIQGRIKINTFSKVILEKKEEKSSFLESSFPFKSGKIVLIKANFASYPLHVMNYFKLTKWNNEDINRINWNFLLLPNIGCNETKEFPLIAYDKLCRPKSEGGQGIKKNEDVNNASLIF